MYATGVPGEMAPTAEITNLTENQSVQAGITEIRGASIAQKGSIQAILIKVDGGAPTFTIPKAADDFSTWSALVDLTGGNHVIETQIVGTDGKGYSRKQSVTVFESSVTLPASPDLLIEATFRADGLG